MLVLEHVSSYYDRIQALKDVSLAVEEGEIVTLIGANGAGKTTLLNSISGLVIPREGRILFRGQDITRLPPEDTVRLGISHVPEHRQLFGSMTVYENLLLGAYHRYRRTPRQELQADLRRVFALFPRLEERQRQLAGTLSGGEQQMLAIAR
jgi:branched-chain amino acid transport system ATP-binding protein